jgi:uncharacterized protein YlzI (FlbEa/FlbD family)
VTGAIKRLNCFPDINWFIINGKFFNVRHQETPRSNELKRKCMIICVFYINNTCTQEEYIN